uniref:Uncharacterized protein n=1 Tax=Octopus bimaculoides TaxID=37653 RepID=A0A0L8I3S9_OCTBM
MYLPCGTSMHVLCIGVSPEIFGYVCVVVVFFKHDQGPPFVVGLVSLFQTLSSSLHLGSFSIPLRDSLLSVRSQEMLLFLAILNNSF